MTEPVHPVARMTVPAKRRGRGRPAANTSTGLRERAWRLMRIVPRFTLDEMLFTLADGSERDAPSNLQRYIRALERVGVVKRLTRRAPGEAPTSNGHVVWRLARDLGRQAPVWRSAEQKLWDPNSQALLPVVEAAAPSKAHRAAAPAATPAGGAA